MPAKKKAPSVQTGHAKTSKAPARPAPENLIPTLGVPEAPEHLGPDGLTYWANVWKAGLDANAYKPDTDYALIDRYCSLQERRLKFLRLLDEEGYLTVGSQGQTVAHPAAKLLADVEAKLVVVEDRLGLSPEARLRLGLATIETKSRLDAFMEDGA